MAMRLPVHGELACRERRRNDSGASSALSSEDEASRVTIRLGNTIVRSPAHAARARFKSVSLPAPLGPTTSTSRPGPIAHLIVRRYGRHIAHATRWPSRQTLRTTGTSCAICTRIRSARLPAAISPRSREADRLGRGLGHGADRGRQIDGRERAAAVAARAISRLDGT